MIYARGHRSDYDTWAHLGNAGWRYEDVLPLFTRSEDFDQGASEYHGAGGPVHVISRYEPHPLQASIVAAAQEAGIPFNDDHNGATLDGVAFCQLTVKDGLRQSAATAFLAPLLGEPRLTVRTGARATRLLVRQRAVHRCRARAQRPSRAGPRRARGRRVRRNDRVPKLLMLSGIGAGPDLARLGIDVIVDLPGVGANLHDHVLSPVIYGASRSVPPPVAGLQQLHSHLFWRSRPGLPGPDIQPLFFHVPLYLEGQAGPADGFTLAAGLVRPASRGALRLASADPEAAPLIDPAYLSCAADVDALVVAMELCREIGRQDALAEWQAEELYPGPGVESVDGLRTYIRSTAITYHHQVGTCAMGVGALAVVDPELRVYGVDGLRVADASIMPLVTSANTHAPALMIGERAAELVAAGSSGGGGIVDRPPSYSGTDVEIAHAAVLTNPERHVVQWSPAGSRERRTEER